MKTAVITDQNMFWMFPVDLILTQRFNSIKKLPKLKMPVLLIHGVADSTLPSFMSQKLYAVAPEPKQLLDLLHKSNRPPLIPPIYWGET